MATNDKLEKVLKGFLKFKKEFHQEAVKDSCYAESFIDSEGHSAIRRPIVVFQNEQHAKHWNKLLDTWKTYVETLTTQAPNHFPKTSELLKLPDSRKKAVSISIYKNPAVNSRLVGADNLIRRLQKMAQLYSPENNRVFSQEKTEIYNRTKKELEYFQHYSDEKFRIRNTGYHEVLAHVSDPSGEVEKIRVNEIGLFITPKSFEEVKIQLPDEVNQQSRRSFYDDLEPIDSVLPFAGNIYREKDVIKARNRYEVKKDI